MRLPRLLATSSISNRTSTAKINRQACNDDAFLVMSFVGDASGTTALFVPDARSI